MAQAKAQIGKERYKTVVQMREHQISADEPEQLNGTNQGATPMELLAASLASCTVITLRMYIDRKEWPISNIDADVEIEPAQGDQATRIQLTVKVEGDIDEKQRKRIAIIASKCPVHKVLKESIHIDTQLIS